MKVSGHVALHLHVFRSAGELYGSLKKTIEDTIKERHFSVDEVLPKQVNINFYCVIWTIFHRRFFFSREIS